MTADVSAGRRPAVFLDRDGVLNHDVGYLGDPSGVALVDDAGPSTARLRDAGFLLVVVTNQSAIGRGIITEAQYAAVTERLLALLRVAGGWVDAVYHCPAVPASGDRTVVEHPDRKPGPGMLLRAAREHDVDLAASWMVGDMISDVLAGHRAGCRSALVGDAPCTVDADVRVTRVPTLADAVDTILAHDVRALGPDDESRVVRPRSRAGRAPL